MMSRRSLYSCLLLAVAMICGCETDLESAPAEVADPRIRYKLEALPDKPTYPPDNALDAEFNLRKILGWRLFYDPILSATNDVACGTCHHALHAMSDARDLSIGVFGKGLGPTRVQTVGAYPVTARNSQTVINAGFLSSLFWDGRARTLEEQSLIPIASPEEMSAGISDARRALDSVLGKLRRIKQYVNYFNQAFPREFDSVTNSLIPSTITATTLAKAIAAFERTLISPHAPYDRFVHGEDTALSTPALRGLHLFYGKAGCSSCHTGAMFTDGKFYGQGVARHGPGLPSHGGSDPGRGAMTHLEADNGLFRTPGLRNVGRTAPYMHNGSVASLSDLLVYYNRGVPADPKAPLHTSFRPLGLTAAELADLEEFLHSLTDDGWLPHAVPPASVPSGLNVP